MVCLNNLCRVQESPITILALFQSLYTLGLDACLYMCKLKQNQAYQPHELVAAILLTLLLAISLAC
jgi:hypothetical protein